MVTNIFNLQPKDRTMQSPQSNIVGSCESLGRKRALCVIDPFLAEYSERWPRHHLLQIGIDYRHQRIELQGCIKDAKNMVTFLTGKRLSPSLIAAVYWHSVYQNTVIRTKISQCLRTRRTINPQKKIYWMPCPRLSRVPRRTIHYFFTVRLTASFLFVSKIYHSHSDSGHGGQIPDKNDDEDDGEDEGFSIALFYSLNNLLTVHILEDIECFDSSIIIDDVGFFPCINYHPWARQLFRYSGYTRNTPVPAFRVPAYGMSLLQAMCFDDLSDTHCHYTRLCSM